MRRLISMAVAALVVGVAASATVGVMAQSEAEPRAVIPAAIPGNAHRVDGKHAVGAGASTTQRAGKLVATNSQGYLPSNILNPRPVTSVAFAYPSSQFDVDPSDTGAGTVPCPTGSRVTGGGFFQSDWDVLITDSRPSGNSWSVGWNNPNAETTDYIVVYAICLGTVPTDAVTVASRAAKSSKAR